MNFKTKEELKNHVEKLKAFYNEFYSFLIVGAFSILIWLLAGAGYFWPVWILVLWGGPLFFKASKLEIVSKDYYKAICSFRDQLPFLKRSWEHDKLQELQKTINNGAKKDAKTPIVKKAATTPKATKTPAPKKTVTKKVPSKKSPTKKAAVKKTPVIKGKVKKTPPAKKVAKKK